MDESETATLQPEAEPRLQIVYILTNPSMPGLVKIGRTTNLEARIASLSSPSSVPEPFHIAYAAYVEDAAFVERGLHAAFSLHRMPGREFFRLPVANAIAALSLAEVAQVSLDAECDAASEFVEEVRVRAAIRSSSGLGVIEALQENGGSVSSNRELARLMGVTDGEASKRCREVSKRLKVEKVGKELKIMLRA